MWPLLGALGLVGLWSFYSGAGGFSYFTGDWIKHFAFLRDLTERPWPVSYPAGETASPMVYYLAYYVPSAVVGKLAGWWWANLTILVWTMLGAMISALWFVILAGRLPLLAAFCFILANGLDFVGDRLISGGAMQPGTAHLDWWAGFTFLNFPGHTSQLLWAPQHSIAAWAVTGLLAVQLADRRGLGHAGFLVALAAFWSPFTVIGLIPFAVAAFFLHLEPGRVWRVPLFRWRSIGSVGAFLWRRLRKALSVANFCAVPLLACAVLFLASKANDLPSGFLWQAHDLRLEWPRLFLFLILEVGVFFIFCRELRRSRKPGLRWLFWTAGAVVLAVPFYKLGDYNDWCMRVPIPALFLMWAGVARSLVSARWHTDTRALLVVCLLGAFGALHETVRTWGPPGFPPPVNYCSHVPELQANVARQYVANPDSFFYRHLARPLGKPLPLNPPPP